MFYHLRTNFFLETFRRIGNVPVQLEIENISSRQSQGRRGLSHPTSYDDEGLEHTYLFDFRVRNSLDKKSFGDNIEAKPLPTCLRRLIEYAEETGRDLLQEVFGNHRSYLNTALELQATTQRTDSTFIQETSSGS